MKVCGPKSEQSAADGKDTLKEGVSWRWYIGQNLGEGVRGVGGGQVERLLALEAGLGRGAGHE